jgi:hypothetical protein
MFTREELLYLDDIFETLSMQIQEYCSENYDKNMYSIVWFKIGDELDRLLEIE